ncbi:MAG: glutathione S-transferase N-terminal domain-containing protein [Litorimonas sp.]
MAITLYGTDLSAHAHRVRLLLHALGMEYTYRVTPRGERGEAWFLSLNPFGQIPVLVDDAVVLPDSNAALVYLAKRYDPEGLWLPETPEKAARVQRWLSVAAGEIVYGPGLARNIRQFGGNFDADQAARIADKLLRWTDAHLEDRDWLASDPGYASPPTIADLACYGYIRLAPEGGIDLSEFESLRAWLGRVEDQDFFFPLPRLTDG